MQDKTGFFQVVVCKARPGASRGDVASLGAALQRWVERQPGFVQRRVVDCGGDTYIDIVEWADAASAEASSRAADHPSGDEMGKTLDLGAMTFLQGPPLR